MSTSGNSQVLPEHDRRDDDRGVVAGRVTDAGTEGLSGSSDDPLAQLAHELDHLRACLEKLIDVVGEQQERSEDIVLLAERMAFFERRILRAEDGVADLSWVVTRRVGDQTR